MSLWTVLGIGVGSLFIIGYLIDRRDARNRPNRDLPLDPHHRFATEDLPFGSPAPARASVHASTTAPRLAVPAPRPRRNRRQVPYLTLVVDNGPVPENRPRRARNPRIRSVT
jgi:hypothetical protein